MIHELGFFLKNGYEIECYLNKSSFCISIIDKADTSYGFQRNIGIDVSKIGECPAVSLCCYHHEPNESAYSEEIKPDELDAVINFISEVKKGQDFFSPVYGILEEAGFAFARISAGDSRIEFDVQDGGCFSCTVSDGGNVIWNGADSETLRSLIPPITDIICRKA